mgnify:CR=1 FL=1
MCTWEEGRVAPIAIESSKDFVDYFIVVDKGSEDGTAKAIEELAEKWGLDIEIHIRPDLFLYEARLFAMKRAQEDWILVQDGDEVFHTNGPNSVFRLRRLLKKFGHVTFCAPMTVLMYDFLHTMPRVHQPPHRFLYYNNGCIIEGKTNAAKKEDLPSIFGIELHLKNVYKFNCNVKSDKRMFLRGFWGEWYKATNAHRRYANLEDYVKAKLGLQDLTPLVEECVRETTAGLIPYDQDRYGYYPKVIRNHIEKGLVRGYV